MTNALERWMDKKNLAAFGGFAPMQSSIDGLLSEVAALKRRNGLHEFAFSPSCDVVEDGHNYVLKFDLPGVPKEMVSVEVDKDQLTVRAERKEEKKHEDKKKYLSEMFYGAYSRSFTLPGPVDEKKVDAKYENGVLTVTVPKTDSHRGKQVLIQ